MKLLKKRDDGMEKQIRRLEEKIEISTDPNETEVLIQQLERLYKIKNQKEDCKSKRVQIYIGYGVTIGTTLVSLLFYNKWMKTGYKFEETGNLASSTFRETRNKTKFKI